MRKYLSSIVVFLWLGALALSAFVAVLDSYRARLQENFNAAATARVTALQRSLQDKLLIMESIRSLYALFEGQPGPAFGAFVKPFESRLQGVQALLWVVPVTAQERQAFELARQQEGVDGFRITERDASGHMVAARDRALYFPVYPLLPLDLGEATIGFDMASHAVRRDALERALATGVLTASARVDLIQERSAGEYGFLLFSPLFAQASGSMQKAGPLLGFVTGVFRISNVVNEAHGQFTGEALEFTLRDLSAPAESQLLYTNAAAVAEHRADGFFSRVFLRLLQPDELVAGFTLGGRYWEMTARPLPAYLSDKPPVAALLILATGLFLAIGTSAYLALRQAHAERLGREQGRRELLENQLIRAQKLEAIGQLVGGVAHDFNNVLTSIIGYGELAGDSLPRDSEAAQHLRVIMQSSEKGRGLIRKLLSFSRNQPARAEPRALQPLTENIMAMLQPIMTTRIEMRLDADPDLPLVSIDSTSFDQLLVNLCVNARDAIAGNGQVRIALQCASGEHGHCAACGEALDGERVMLSVADSGSGMSAQLQMQIFQPFFTTKEDGKGTGLGLSIVNNVVHGCGGHILVESAPDAGTTFRLLFPPA